MAGPTRLELATSGVTGRRSNQLNYDPAKLSSRFRVWSSENLSKPGTPNSKLQLSWWAVQDLNLWPPACKADALPLS